MFKYTLKRIAISLLTIFIVITATFFLIRAIPGGPFTGEKKLPPSILENLNKKFGLDKPMSQQYTTYVSSIVTKGDLGPSMMYEGTTVNDIIKKFFPVSAKLGLASVVFSLIFGVLLGILSALKENKWQDRLSMVISTIGVTVPSFVMATLLTYVFAIKLKLFPAIGLKSVSSYVLPTIALGGYSMAFVSRLSRSSLVEVLRQDFIRVAKAKGLPQRVVIVKHALRNSLIPIITYVGPLLASVLTGSFVVESIFGIPGLGREFVTSISNRDYTEIMGLTIFYCAFLVICNLIVDILYGFVDPRIKIQD
ncbi:ABC transporter permease [Clostridium folliculivorans]|uniref:Peptide ABC transporter permease n=1 Tax=Clostridium folliculivorans TaxID=2886038 RepID=A0A9W5XYM4_9CLOT|nr:ABC transporter permease [Clostridium folliculivorans]GKU23350.1 peptide ABC transporter permease [Clostridium folliculivorans]GKU29467.1 peptide ABC transporter permease [Clostridium folliculivorans]